MENIEYKIGHIIYIQGELTWAQDKALIGIYNSVSNKAFKNEELKLKELQGLLMKYNLLNHFFGIILKPKITLTFILSLKWIKYLFKKQISLNVATNSQIAQIFSDFFLLNKKFVNKLTELTNALGLIATQAQVMKEQKNKQQSEKDSTLKNQAKILSIG